MRAVWQQADPDLPAEVEPFSFVSAGLLGHVARALSLSPGETLVDLGCGRGGPGLWLARLAGASLVGVDFSAEAVDQASRRAGSFGLDGRAQFVVGDLAATGLADAVADAVVSVDALHFAADVPAAGRADATGDEALAALQGEARQHLPLAGLVDRVVVTATRPTPGPGD
jgi:cyclopropane fatty-acyl-phospholipid synthase-like methyltransferase